MKIFAAAFLPCVALSFGPSATFIRKASSSLSVGSDPNVFLGGNTWKPDSEKMGSTDTGDYFPEGYTPDEQPAFSEGMGGSQSKMGGGGIDGPQLPGMEHLGEDAVVQGGIEVASEIPEGMDFTPSSIPDGSCAFSVGSSGEGAEHELLVAPVCMTFEDFFASFSPDSHPSLSVSPVTGRMDRRGGEPSALTVTCAPQGASGELTGTLVINLPEDNSKICYTVTVTSV